MIKIFYFIAFISMFISVNAQNIEIWQKGEQKPINFPIEVIDSMTVSPCDTSIYDLEGCDLDIDTTFVSVSCGNLVNIQTIFDGTPSYSKYTIYDSAGVVIFTAYNTPMFTFTLPGPGIFYGIVEASCGGGDEKDGDSDEEAFEIINSMPVADFAISSKFNCVNGVCERVITTTDNSEEADILSYTWNITDVSSGTFTTFTTAEPTYVLDPTKKYEIELTIQDSKGCSDTQTLKVQNISTCSPKFDWSYSWCDSCKQGTSTADINVKFVNYSEFSNCSSPIEYTWDFGDPSSTTNTSNETDPSHVFTVPCDGQSFSVSLTMTSGTCTAVWDTLITINSNKPIVGVTSICCDGLVFFYTDAVKGKWSTPGSLGIPKWPAVSKKIWKPFGIQVGQNYRQYYSTPGTYYVTVNGAVSEDHNVCPVSRVPFTIDKVECFNRNVKIKGTDVVDGIKVKYKFSAIALPFVHRMKSKIKTVGFKKVAEISTDFAGEINKKDAMGCFCATQNISDASGVKTNKRKAKAATSTSGKFRIGMDKATANFYLKTKSGTTKTWELKLGFPPCDHPWFMFY